METRRPADVGPGPSAVQLSACIELMQADLLLANPTPATLARGVSDVLMYDPLDAWRDIEGRLILAVGFTCGTAEFDQLLYRAAESNAAAVVVKAHGAALDELRQAAGRHTVAVLLAPDDADWTRLAALARASVSGVAADAVAGVRLGDLYAFANAAASITNGAASIVDPLGRVLGYSTLPGQQIDELRRATTLALQETTPPVMDADFKTAYGSPTAVLIPATDEALARLALAVRAGGELLGTLWIIDPGEDRRAAALQALDRMAPLAGLHMLHARSAADFGERRNADLIRTLLDDRVHARFAAGQLGFGATDGLAVAAFSVVRPETGSLESVREIHRLLHLVTTVCSLELNSGHTALIDSVVYALLPCDGSTPRAGHRRVAQDVARYAHTISGYPLVAAVGGIAPRVEDLSTSRSEALQILEYHGRQQSARADGRGRAEPVVALYEDNRVPLSLLKIGAFIGENRLDQPDEIARIRAQDDANRTDYLDTLRAYLETNGNISQMAGCLHVHTNTVRYRIARLTRDLGLDDPQRRLWLWLRLATDDLAEPRT